MSTTATDNPSPTDAPAPSHDDALLREAALDRLKKRQDFRAHLLVYTLVCGLLWSIWALTGAAFPWPLIVMGGWGVGLVMNAYEVYGRAPIREQDIQREIERLRDE